VPKGTFRSIVTDIASGLAGCVLAVCWLCAGGVRCVLQRAALPRTQPPLYTVAA
jgi:hypothetical protein